jgi:hypothetical protein
MTMFRNEKEERALETEAAQRAVAANIDEPARKPDEPRDDYHARVWAAIQNASTN